MKRKTLFSDPWQITRREGNQWVALINGSLVKRDFGVGVYGMLKAEVHDARKAHRKAAALRNAAPLADSASCASASTEVAESAGGVAARAALAAAVRS